MAEWINTKERRPAEGEIVLAYWPDDATGPAFRILLEYHYRKSKHEANSHVWHRPCYEQDDYSEPTHWMTLPESPHA